MALLNYADTHELVKKSYDIDNPSSGDYVKLFFTKDKHIVTHGVDYMSLFSEEQDGLVPKSSGNPIHVLKASGEWDFIKVADLPIKTTLEEALDDSENTILSTQQVSDYISQSFAANDAMRFRGTIKQDGGTYIVDTDEGISNKFPTVCYVGDTYKVTGDGTYAGKECNFGDMLICVKDGYGDNLNNEDYWTIVEYNLEYAKFTINDLNYYIASPQPELWNNLSLYIPTEIGNAEQILMGGQEGIPEWVHKDDITVGKATKTEGSLSLGQGLEFEDGDEKYDGSTNSKINLVAATTNTIGGIIVDGLTAEESSKENNDPTISIKDGHLYLSQQNIINALGYVPSDNATRWRPISVGEISLEDRNLYFDSTANIQVILDDSEEGVAKVSYTLGWYNINKKQFEYDEDSL